ncbi:NADH dehydrogenase [ubiquinone] 1 beta subcomplex subunit 2, mitochondrial-like [Sitophilus oryzae]|uniref:NADH dehydrogenase [ubiquinone] 1 beta subcomplex subunit 2, mitochondrial-like n=1 Tax=Sitophilus oryzae TaxID=7048 RepID=A0A6J2XKC9_SITOR|nr:NADH dehydrogenase [ubiquinone] 1 beta subcomplex subunit 2, mitochondrial-like [Sitophilus oryzae]
MLISRGASTLRILKTLSKNGVHFKQAVRNSGHDFYYRSAIPEHKKSVILRAEIVQGLVWWWILWHLWTEPDHVFGEFGEYPDPSKWSDEELGIPEEL